MSTNVFANGNEICSKTANGRSLAVFPDPCWSPPAPPASGIVIPYPNTALAKSLEEGSTTVLICKEPVALRDVSYLANSLGNEPATYVFQKGLKTKVIKGKAYFTDWSPNVKFEGLNVCRHNDPMTHNHG
jgi:Domain of unknown function (DUF4150)